MRLFRVIIANSVGAELYNDVIEATDENEALLKVLKDEIVYSGDTISIDEE